jgi:sulfide:quinone oxidoreductase
MKQLVILGAGTAGTILANRMRKQLPSGWKLTVVDPSPTHLYQPGLLFLPFGAHDEARLKRERRRTLGQGIEWIEREVAGLDLDRRAVSLAGGETLSYDLLVIASGARLRPDLTPGLTEGEGWRKTVHEFYTLEGAQALREAMAKFEGGRLLVNIVEMPIKCPVAPLELVFLADAFFTDRKMRDRVEMVFATPLDGCFTRPLASRKLNRMVVERKIVVEKEFATGEVDSARRVNRSFDERELAYDLLVTIPTHSGAEFVERSGIGNELAFVPTDRQTLQMKGNDHVFVIGDATDLPSSKAGSVAHFQSEVLEENLLRAMDGRSLEPGFDGHANCFVESGHGRALLIDFNYDVEPLPGRFPVPVLGPFKLLGESKINHLGKLGFRWLYWNALLPGRPIPLPARMSMAGKEQPETAAESV